MVTSLPSSAFMSARTALRREAISSEACGYTAPQHCHSGSSRSSIPSALADARAYMSICFALSLSVQPG